jgi:hypothetical protein
VAYFNGNDYQLSVVHLGKYLVVPNSIAPIDATITGERFAATARIPRSDSVIEIV